jgi:hypothetical protein
VARIRKYVYLGGYVGGTGHGSPHDYDRQVPIVFMGPGIRPGRRDVETGPEDIAWALGRLLGLDYPQQDSVIDLVPLPEVAALRAALTFREAALTFWEMSKRPACPELDPAQAMHVDVHVHRKRAGPRARRLADKYRLKSP